MRIGDKQIDGREVTTASVFIGVSLITLGESYRLATNPPVYRLDQPLKPGMFLAIAGVLLLVSGLIYLTGLMRHAQDSATAEEESADERSGSVATLAILMGILAAYTLLIGWLGYTLASFLFFLATCRFFGLKNPVALVCWSLLFTCTFAVVFISFLRVQMPSGPLDLLLL